MEPKKILENIRQKPPHVRNTYAVILALVPAVLIGYAQLYMRLRTPDASPSDANTAAVANSGEDNVSAFDALGKIFSEGKKSIGSSVGDLKQIDVTSLQKAQQVATSDTPLPVAAPSADPSVDKSAVGFDESFLPDKYTHHDDADSDATSTASSSDSWQVTNTNVTTDNQ